MENIKKILFFILLALLILGSGNFFLYRAMKDRNDKVLNRNGVEAQLRNERENTIDILSLGDSEGFSSLSPMQMWNDKGYTVFNASQIGQTPIDEYSMLEVTLERQQPKVLIIETNAIFQGGATLNTAFTTFMNQRLHLFRFHNEWKDLTGLEYSQTAMYNGFAIRPDIVPYTGDTNYMESNDAPVEVGTLNQFYLDLIRKKCEKEGISLIFYSVPSPTNYTMSKHNWMQAYADQYDIPYIDFNLLTEEIGLDWSRESLDGGDHVNISGAQKITAYLEGYLEEHYQLTDHRTDSGEYVEEWNAEAAEYQAYAEPEIQKIRGEN